jgi:hypothetical protein
MGCLSRIEQKLEVKNDKCFQESQIIKKIAGDLGQL